MLTAPRAHGQSASGAAEPVQQAAIELATKWLGPPPALHHGFAIDFARPWPRIQRDQSYERRVIATVFRRMWQRDDLPRPQSPVPLTPFEEALAVYTGTRAIHELLEGSNFEVVRFFGGLVPFPLRSVLLSPPVADPRPRALLVDEWPATPEVVRAVRTLQTIERYVGWPAMVQTLAALRATRDRQLDAAAFANTLSLIRGTDVRGLIAECFRPDVAFDYAIADVRSSMPGQTPVETSVTMVRHGSGAFEVGTAGDPERTLPLLLQLSDGSEVRDWFDGSAKSTTLVYTTNARVVSAAIDPEMMLLVDADRANNTFTTAVPFRPLGVRLALHWMSWLQQMMLTYSALV
jgi:hypothetical protein